MKQSTNPVTLFSKKGARLESTLFKAKWEVLALKLAVLLKRDFTYENCFSNFLRNCFLEVCEQQIVKDYITRTLSLSLCLSVSLSVSLAPSLSSLSLSPLSLCLSLPERLTKNLIFSFFYNFGKFLGKRLCWSHFLMWLQVLG